jgi:chemotaxis response regulator CheB
VPEEAPVTTESVATKNIKVLMVDDHEIMRQAYGMLLNTDPDIEIVGFAGDGQEALVLADTLGPNVVIMDGRMPRLNGVDAARIIREKHPDMAIVLLSAFDDDEFVREFLKGNVRGKAYLLKQSLQASRISYRQSKTSLRVRPTSQARSSQNSPVRRTAVRASSYLNSQSESVKFSTVWLEVYQTQQLLKNCSFSPERLNDTSARSSRRCDSNPSRRPTHAFRRYLPTSRTPDGSRRVRRPERATIL